MLLLLCVSFLPLIPCACTFSNCLTGAAAGRYRETVLKHVFDLLIQRKLHIKQQSDNLSEMINTHLLLVKSMKRLIQRNGYGWYAKEWLSVKGFVSLRQHAKPSTHLVKE